VIQGSVDKKGEESEEEGRREERKPEAAKLKLEELNLWEV
jgi:hypothetical protein